MSADILSRQIQCPYCWELIDVSVDNCGENQQYIEDCQVCCRPINFEIIIEVETQQVQINVFAEDDA